VQLRFPNKLQAFAGDFLCVKGNNPKPVTTIESSAVQLIPQLGQAAPEDLVTYLMVTAEVKLSDAV